MNPGLPQELSEDEMVRVLSEPRNSLLRQYTSLLAMNGARFMFTKGGMRCGGGVPFFFGGGGHVSCVCVCVCVCAGLGEHP